MTHTCRKCKSSDGYWYISPQNVRSWTCRPCRRKRVLKYRRRFIHCNGMSRITMQRRIARASEYAVRIPRPKGKAASRVAWRLTQLPLNIEVPASQIAKTLHERWILREFTKRGKTFRFIARSGPGNFSTVKRIASK